MPSADAPTTTDRDAAPDAAGEPAAGAHAPETEAVAEVVTTPAPVDLEAAAEEPEAPPVAVAAPLIDDPTEAAAEQPEAPQTESQETTEAAVAPRRGPAAPRAAAPRGFPRAERPGNVPVPQHHHLPGWVRRDYAKVRPALADLLGLLQGEERAQFQRRVDELTEGISSGKFSLAFQYPEIVAEGRKLYEGQREHIVEVQRAQRVLEGARRRAGDKLREAADSLAPDAAARLNRVLRSASDAEAIAAVESEAQRALGAARSTQSKRRDREIERTRNQIRRTLPKAAAVAEEPQAETWQDVLRRFADEQKAGAGSEN